ncbi:unnamed protein product [Ixodes pacificus]
MPKEPGRADVSRLDPRVMDHRGSAAQAIGAAAARREPGVGHRSLQSSSVTPGQIWALLSSPRGDPSGVGASSFASRKSKLFSEHGWAQTAIFWTGSRPRLGEPGEDPGFPEESGAPACGARATVNLFTRSVARPSKASN